MAQEPHGATPTEPSRSARTARAGLISFGGTVAQVGIQAVSLAVLARLLTPTDFGVYGMAMAFVGFSALFRDMGLSAAAVQAKSLSHQTQSNLFWINTGIGLALTTIVAVSAPFVSLFFQEPAVSTVLVLMAPTLLLAGMSVQYSAILMRSMRFPAMTTIKVVGAVLGLAASITIAVLWGGVWALALPQLISGVVTFLLFVSATRWRPSRPRRDGHTRPLLSFGAGLFGAQVVTYAHRNFDVVLIGRMFGAVWTGHLNRATQVARMPLSMLTAPFAQIALARMSRFQDDRTQLARLMTQGQTLQVFPLLLAAGALLATADQVVVIVLGPGWEEVATLIRLIVVVEVMGILPSAVGWLLSAQGRGNVLFFLGIMTAMFKIVAMLIGSIWGPVGVVAGNAVGAALSWPVTFLVGSAVTGIPTRPLFVRGVSSLTQVSVIAVGGWAAGQLLPAEANPLLVAAVAGVGIAVCFAAMAAFVPPFRRDALFLWETVRSARRK